MPKQQVIDPVDLVVRDAGEGVGDYGAMRNGYSAWTIIVRLIVGSFSAIIFYFLIAEKHVRGELFPDVSSSESLFGFPVATWKISNVPSVLPNGEFAELIVWSTLAGFSERLVSDRFSNLEAALNEKKPNPA